MTNNNDHVIKKMSLKMLQTINNFLYKIYVKTFFNDTKLESLTTVSKEFNDASVIE